MPDREKVIKALEVVRKGYVYKKNGQDVISLDVRFVDMILALLKEQDTYRKWLMDMFHKYGHDEFIALLVDYGEENLIADMLKEQEAVPLTIDDAVSEIMDKHYKRLKEQETELCDRCGRRRVKSDREVH